MKSKTIIFDKFPSNTLIGDEFGEEQGFQIRKMANNFQVIRVHGRVRWKYRGSDDDAAVLTLKRGNFRTQQNLKQLELAEYARGTSPDEATTVEFDFEPDVQNPFWQRGAAGEISFHSHLLSH